MPNKSSIAAFLAVTAMLGFLVTLAVLGFMPVPVENKDFLNMGFVALIGFVSTAFGFYLGSSYGSARKSEILAGAVAPPPPPDAGFIRLPLLAGMLLICLALGSLAGCSTIRHATSTDTPETIMTAQDRAQSVVMGFQAAFAVTPEIVDALLANGAITPHTYNTQILPAYNRGLASLAVVVAALQAAQDAQQDPNQTQAYTVALARFLTDKAAVDNLLTAMGGGAK